MYGSIYGSIYFISLLISIILLFLLYRVKAVKLAKYLFIGDLILSFWIAMETLSYFIMSADLALLFQKYKLIGAIFIPPLCMAFAVEYHNTKYKSLLFKLAFFIIPVCSLLSLLTNRFPYKFISNPKIKYIDHIPSYTYHVNVGFRIHTCYSYIVILLVCIMFMIRTIHSPQMYKRQNLFLCIGSFLGFIMNFLVLSLTFGSTFIDLTSLCILFTIIVMYWGIFRLPRTTLVPKAKNLFLENISDVTIILDANDTIIDMNPAAIDFILNNNNLSTLSYSVASTNFTGLKLQELYKLFPSLLPLNTVSENASSITFHFKDKTLYYNAEQTPILDKDQFLIGKLIILHNITEIQKYINNLKVLNNDLILSDRIIDSALEGVLITDTNGVIVKTNKSFQKMSGYSDQELLGKNPRIFKSGKHDLLFYKNMWDSLIANGYWNGEVWNRSKNGNVYPEWKSVTALHNSDGSVQNYISISTDISQLKETEEALHNLAYYDELTGLANKNYFYEKLRERIEVSDKQSGFALLLMDLDGFKLINDSLGHSAGDVLLKEVSMRLQLNLGNNCSVYRFGGDEFVILIETISDSIDAVKAAQSFIEMMETPFLILERQIILGISIGITIAHKNTYNMDELVRRADAAMYAAKEAGKNRYAFFSEEIDKKNHDTLDMQTQLKSALDKKEFRLYLQPQVSSEDGKYVITGAEALIRWRTLDGKIYTPDKFIPVSESNGMIIPIGNWIVDEIFRIDKLLKEQDIDIKLSINVSSKQLEDNSLLYKIKDMYQNNALQRIHLVIEITESILLQDIDKAIEVLNEIKSMGIGISLDDFGTGFSSLSYLTRLPLDYIKIDKSFIDDFAKPNTTNLTANIIAIAKTLNLKTVAEGVETLEQVNKLLEEKCDQLQGYYFNRPLDIPDFIEYVHNMK